MPKTVMFDEAIEKALADLNKTFGPGTIGRLGEKVALPIPSIPTGIYGVDYGVLGIGGIPRGRISEFFGPESGGKTTLALRVIASAQRMGLNAAFIDAEYAFDPRWAVTNGVDVNNLLVTQPNTGEEGIAIAEKLVHTEKLGVIVVDSVPALVPKAELDGDIGDAHVGLQARLMAQACRLLVAPVGKTNTALIFINQIREKIGVTYGSNETTPGGRSLRHYASVRLDVRKIGFVKENEQLIGNQVRIKAPKNKCAAQYQETEIELLYGSGFDERGNLFDEAVLANVIHKSGAWYSFGEERLGQGRNAAKQAMDANKVLQALKGYHGEQQ